MARERGLKFKKFKPHEVSKIYQADENERHND